MAAMTRRCTDERLPGDARPGRRAMAPAAELRGDVIDVHRVGFGAQADAGQSGSTSSKMHATTTGSKARRWSIRPSVSSRSAPVRAKSRFLSQR